MPSMPFPSTPPPRARIRDPPAGGRSRRSATAAGLFGSGDPERLLDLRHDPGFWFEELLGDRLPAAERVDREQAGRSRELGGSGHARDHGAIALFGPDLLGGRGEQVMAEKVV